MLTVTFIIAMLAMGIIFPNAMKFLVAAPILGFCFGGFFFAIACCLSTEYLHFHIFGVFILVATIVAEIIIFRVD